MKYIVNPLYAYKYAVTTEEQWLLIVESRRRSVGRLRQLTGMHGDALPRQADVLSHGGFIARDITSAAKLCLALNALYQRESDAQA